ncbi:hypothetical protein ABB37_02070 [Leptomonas pyrrhocoris]|uniref:Uncharacterized protein n=1 Tax=Leptomonas pyrrhocoris TaxID=157538 RepID=A0A0N0DYD9_LEPPY|nr:hypothetical protein ABB37_02070 [Leptomonas pyrrhocoris]KPA83882.1 hypothetical protein ABB37_02070 [Leptomonas pyrrhocoris]|eukprot:XP_015662321.1 hypothetical protein ABB37_02070 [Leptomonas pyrrhocoris]
MNDLLKMTQRKTIARRQKIDLFVLSVAHEKEIHYLSGHSPSSSEEVSKLLRENGEEEVMEEECLCRYEAFVTSKRSFFSDTGTDLDNAATLLFESMFEGAERDDLESGRGELLTSTRFSYNELHEFCLLCDAAARLHRLTTMEVMAHKLTSSLGEDKSLLAEKEKLDAHGALLNKAIVENENQLSTITARLRRVRRELAVLEVENEAGAAREEVTPVVTNFQEDRSAVAAAKKAVETIQGTTANWMRRKQEADSTKTALRDKADGVTDRITACKQAVISIALSTEEIARRTDELREKCVGLSRDLDLKERYRLQQIRLLEKSEASYQELKSKVSRLADDDNAKTAQLNNAEFDRREICLRIDSAKQNSLSVKTVNARLKELLEEVQSERELLEDKIQYLGGLVPDQTNLKRLMGHCAKKLDCAHISQATGNYLDFVQKARASQRARLNKI